MARLILAITLLLSASAGAADAVTTFCNPLNLDYGIYVRAKVPFRHGADPVVSLFNNRYYLFSTWDRPGYRVSDDLVTWKYIPFAEGTPLHGRVYTAAATMERDGWLYFVELGGPKTPVSMWRTRDPDGGVWEVVREGMTYRDPCLFIDPPTGRVFMYHGLEEPLRGVELDRETFAEIEGTHTQLMPPIDRTQRLPDGWEVCTWDNDEASPPMRGNKTFLPCREGAWMTFVDGRYYLQFATPGTTVPGYCDGLLMGDSPLGPFEMSPHSPISRKDSGFITSAGHSSLFQDRHGNWWRAVTMLVGVHDRFERRIGLYPAGFDRDGVPYTRTDLGDLPIVVPQGKREHDGDQIYAGWWVLSRGKAMTASSTLEDGNAPGAAADEDVRTWWSARSGDAGEWLQLDLGEKTDVHALQVNLAEQDITAAAGEQTAHPHQAAASQEATRYRVEASQDGKTWKLALDRSAADGAAPHLYAAFDPPLRARYVRVTNVATPAGGKFAVSDLRAFGAGGGKKPEPVKKLSVKRNAEDRRQVSLSWRPSARASGYLIRYGADPHKMYLHYQINDGSASEVTLHCLSNEPGYFFTIEPFNESGLTRSGSNAVPVPAP